MKKRIFSRILALAMALSLLSTTAFAASFADLQNAINGTGGTADAPEYYGREEGATEGGIAAWNQDGNRNVQLNDTVEYVSGGSSGISISGKDKVVTIDLNGNTIDGTGKPVDKTAIIAASGGSTLTIKDTSTEKAGTITGGNSTSYGSAVAATGGGTVYVYGGNFTGNSGNAVLYANGGTLNVSGSKIFDNAASGIGMHNSTVSISDGAYIAENKASGIVINQSTVTISDTTIEKNTSSTAKDYGAGMRIATGANVTMTNVTVTNNTTGGWAGGIAIMGGSTVNASNGCKIYGNTAGSKGDDIGIATGTIELPSADGCGEDAGKHQINGWYLDGSSNRWSENTVSKKLSQDSANSGTYLKAAHNKLYTVTVNPGNGTDPTVTDAEIGQPAPLPDPDDEPTNPGYIFDGWVISGVDENGEPTETPFDPDTFENPGGDNIVLIAKWSEDPNYVPPTTNGDGNDTTTVTPGDPGDFTAAGGAATTTIEDEETPLAGIVTLADLLNALWEYEGIEEVELPEDFKWLDHDYAQAICWGLDEALVVDTEDDPLDPDELLTVGLMREVLVNFVELYHGLEDFEVILEGADEDLVMDLGERLTVFYGELEAALEAQAA